ncbi:autotransporter-associated beta strand repeat-containing protein, partial [Mesorhizobium sp. CO1-1-8]|uniref:autotransporter-associated beta strand repeat-containing protein n=1 Tax=Mesorhizobium sp. CO1-1-8 TaxID=2876631 RepID=UPI001CD097BC
MQQTTRHQASGTQRQSKKTKRESETPAATAFSHILRGGRMTKWKGEAASFAPNAAQVVSDMPKTWTSRLLSAALLLGLASGPAAAADFYWDANGTTPGSGGTGTWTTAGLLWSPNTNGVSGPYTAWNNGNQDKAIFATTAGTVTLGAPFTVGGLEFDVNNYTVTGSAGNTLTINGATPTINVVTGGSTISAVLANTAGFTKTGGGALTVSSSNSFTGGISVNAGTLTLSGSNNIAGNIILNAGALNLSGTNSLTGTLTVAAGTANITGTTNFTGAINLSGGRTIVSTSAALGDLSNVITLADGARLDALASLAGRTINLTGTQAQIAEAGTGDAHFTGIGGLQVVTRANMTDDTNDYTGATSFVFAGNASFTSVRNAGLASSLGAGSGANATIQATAVGTSTLSYKGDGDTSDRSWEFLGSSNVIFANQGTGTLVLTGNLTGTDPSTGSVLVFEASTADMDLLGVIGSASNRTIRFSGGGAGRNITLGGLNNYTGPTIIGLGSGAANDVVTVNASVLADTGSTSSFGTGTAGGITIQNGSVLSYTGTGSSSNRSWAIGGTGAARFGPSGSILNNGTGALALGGAVVFGGASNNNLTLGGSYGGINTASGAISGNGNLVSAGSGTWVLTGANSRTGAVTVNGGTLRAGSASAFGTTTGITTTAGMLDLNGFNMSATSLTGTGGTLATGGANLSLNMGAGVNSTYGGSIAGSGGSLTKLGAGALTLTGANTYTGATTIGGGTLTLDFSPAGGPTSSIISASSALNMGGGRLNIIGAAGEANSQAFGGLNITGGNNTIDGSLSGASLDVSFGTINHAAGLVNFVLPSTGSFATANADGALGGWATINGSDYAKVLGGHIVAFAAADYVNKDNAADWLDNEIISDAGGFPNTPFGGTVSGTVQIGGLQYTAAATSNVTIAAGSTLGVEGTIIVAPSVGSSNQTITGGSITGAAGGGTLGVQQNGTGTFTIASKIVDSTGVVGFAKAGAGTVVLSGANTYTGATTVTRGTLSINSVANAGTASAIGAASVDPSNLQLQGATLNYTGGTASSDRGFTIGTNGAITSNTINVSQNGTNLTFGGVVTSSDNASLTKTGAGTLTLANAGNNYIGVTTISGGALAVGTLANGGLASGIGASSNDSANLILNGGELSYIGATASSDRGFTLQSASTISVTNAASTLTLSGTATGPAGFFKNGAGTLVLAGTNNFAGNVVVNAGVLRAGSTQAFGSAIATVNFGATLALNNFSNSVAGLAGTGAVSVGSGTLTITHGFNSAFSGAISGTGGLTKSGPGTQTMSGCGNNYSGATTINGGTLSVDCLANGGLASGIGASGAASGNLVLASGTLQYTGSTVSTNRGFTLQSGTSSLDVNNAGATLTFSGAVVGGGALSKSGPGTLVLSGSNTYTGGTSVAAGTLRAGSINAFGTGGMSLSDSTTLDLNSFNTTVSSLTGAFTTSNVDLKSATLTISNGSNQTYAGVISGAGGLSKSGAAGLQTLSGCASSYTGSTVINNGILAVSCLGNGGGNSSIGASSAAASNLVLNGGTLRYIGAGGSTDRLFTLGASATSKIEASGTGALIFANSGAIAYSSPGTAQTIRLGGTNTDKNSFAPQITDNGAGLTSFTKEDTGTWILTNPNSTYSGVTTVNGGVLGVDKLANGGSASSIGAATSAASNLVIGNGSTLRYTGTGDTTDRLFTLSAGVTFIESAGAGAIAFTNTGVVGGGGARVVALGGSNSGANLMAASITNGTIGTTTLAKNDTGTWYLTGTNTYTGNTNVNAGILYIGNGGTTGSIASASSNVSAGAVLGFNRSDAFTFAGTISGAGQLAQIGTGTTVLTAAGNDTGGTSVSAGTLQVNGGLTTPTVTMTGTSALTVNGTVGATGGGTSAITGDAGASAITVGAAGTLRASGDLGGGSDIVNLTGTLNTGAGALNLGAGNDTLTLNDGGVLTGTVNGGTGGETGPGDTLRVINTVNRTVQGAGISGFESLDKQGSGTLTLVGDHSYSGGTTIQGGTLQVGSGATAGTLTTPTVANNGTLAFNLNNNYSFDGLISGTGSVNKLGTGITTLTGANTYTGATNVNAGTLLVNGNQSAANGQTTVATGATLGGSGIIGGSVTVADGATLAPGGAGNVPGTLTINGSLALGDSTLNVNFGQAGIPGGPLNDLINVGGNLTLDGTLNVTESPGGDLGPGVYRIINYTGSLTNNILDVSDPNYFVQTAVAKQVNLINSAGLALSFWDGNVGPHSNGTVDGGSGTWRAAGDRNWTDSTGLFAAPFANASFAIFQGAAGTVTVDSISNGQVQAAGMQFTTDGYRVQGGAIALVGPQSIIRVGDGTLAGATYVATIASNLTGSSQLVKTDAGTLVLSGTNSYSGGTAINGGTVQISSDTNLGAGGGALSLDGGTLHTTAIISSARAVALNAGGGTFDTDAATTLGLNGIVAGAGALTKEGSGTLILAGANTYQGGTVINGGTIEVSSDANLGNGAGNVTFDGGTLHVSGFGFNSARDATLNAGGGAINVDNFVDLAGTIEGTGALTAGGPGFLALSGDNTYTGGTTIANGVLQLGSGGTTGSILGDVVDNGNLGFDRSDTYSFDGLISGSGQITQVGSGTTVLTADNSYAGTTRVLGGSLYINGDQSAATGLTTVNAGTLGGNGIIGGDVTLAPDSTLAPGGLGTTPGTLTINGSLQLAAGSNLDYSFGQAGVVGGAYNDLTVVHGNLALNGAINVTQSSGGNFGPGIYRVISYDGNLTDNGLDSNSPTHIVQTSIAGQVNLVDISAMTLNFWDGDAGPKSNNAVNGGNGTWRAAGDDNWTGPAGDLNAAFTNGSFAIFAGSAGTVSVDNTNGQVQAAGMQFATDGYLIQGQNIELLGPQSTIRVGDGTLPGAGYTATIASVLRGSSQLVKTDLGTLVLAGTNTYTGGTAIEGGTLQVSADANLGDSAGALSFDNGATLQNTAAFGSARDVTLNAGNETFQTDADLTLSGLVSGAGGLTKTGSSALTLTGTNTYAGTTTVAAGGLYVDGDQSAATGLTSVQIGATLGGKGKIGGNVTIADGATLSPGPVDGTPGTLAIAGNLSLSGGSILNYSFGEADVVGGALNDLTTVGGNLVLDGTLNVSASAGGSFGPGVYRVFDYSGTLTNNG